MVRETGKGKLNPWKIQGFKPGQNVICKIMRAEPGGYAVIIANDLPGFLPSTSVHKVGAEVLAQFVCVDRNRMLLSERFTTGAGGGGGQPRSAVNWEEQLEELDNVYATGKHQSLASQKAQDPNQPPAEQYNTGGQQPYHEPQQAQQHPDQYDTGGQQPYREPQQAQQHPDQYDTSSQQAYQQPQPYQTGNQPTIEEQAFETYAANVPARKFQLRRAIDLIMPPIDEESLKTIRIGDYDVEWLITDLEGGMRTGCVKATCESRLSRAAMLLYRGRAVGCIYGSKADPNTKATPESLNLMLQDLESPDTQVALYDLPEAVTLAMSSLFLGYPVTRKDDYSALEYMDYICDWFEKEQGTATLAISLSGNRGTCLGYIFKGQFVGAFYVEDQRFSQDKQFVYDLLKSDNQAGLEVSILPPEMTSSSVRFGYSLSMSRTRKPDQL
ncbi:MAG: hypothetical protein K8F91_17435 [Candidatus Obscuribacterales bacterium]|nr:hypothetical protein [Candidatus Obscuribacterales bacterium]